MCKCGRTHTERSHIFIAENIVDEITRFYNPQMNVLAVADINTLPVYGGGLLKCFADSMLYIYPEAFLIPDERAVEGLTDAVRKKKPSGIFAIGSGTINDICRLVSHKTGLPYSVAASAPSMDGYASGVSPIIQNGKKLTYEAAAPEKIFCGLDILRAAPIKMIGAGLGDMLGKYNSLNDWELSHIINGEYFCEYTADIVRASVLKCVSAADGLYEREISAVKALTEGLLWSGTAMIYAGNSRPASGAEHHLSHYWEQYFIANGRHSALHGEKVGVAMLVIIKLYELFLSDDAERILLNAPDKRYRDNARKLINTAAANIPGYMFIENLLMKTRSHVTPQALGVDRELFIESVLRAKDLRDRFTVLTMLSELGLLERYTEKLMEFYY